MIPTVTPKRLTVVTLGVENLSKSTDFYEEVFGVPAIRDYEGVAFFDLAGTWISLYPIQNLAEDISPDLPRTRSGFSGITLAHNARSKEDVLTIFEHVKAAGATVVKAPHDTFWGGFSGYFSDPDGYHWEVVWAPMFDFTDDGGLRFQR